MSNNNNNIDKISTPFLLSFFFQSLIPFIIKGKKELGVLGSKFKSKDLQTKKNFFFVIKSQIEIRYKGSHCQFSIGLELVKRIEEKKIQNRIKLGHT